MGAGIAAGSAEAAPQIRAGCQTNAWPVDPAKFETLLDALLQIRQLGFAGYETGFRNLQDRFAFAADTRRKLEDSFGLKFFGIHIFLLEYDPVTRIAPEALALKVLAGGAALGAERLILSGGSCTQNGVFDAAAAGRKAEGLNKIGARAREAGLTLCYHNHGPEFAGGGAEIQALLSGTDPKLVHLLVDAGHAFRAGADLPGFLRKNAARIAGLHLRDNRNGEEVPLGEGSFPLAAVAAAAREAKWHGWVLNEEERNGGGKPGNSAVAPARAALRKAFGV